MRPPRQWQSEPTDEGIPAFSQPAPDITLIATARRLRKTRAACQKFLALWALQQGHSAASGGNKMEGQQLNGPMNHDWSLLYLGSILDD